MGAHDEKLERFREFIRKRGDVYETREYQDADHRLDLSIESGLGSVKVRRY